MKIWLKRSLRTFFQAAIGYISANLALSLSGADENGIKTVVIGLFASAIAAGIAAVMNSKEV